MTPTTATTGPPSVADGDGLTVRQRASHPLEVCVRERIARMHRQGTRRITLADFTETARCTGRPLSWIGDHLIVLEGIGILTPDGRSPERAWTVNDGTEYLR